MNFIEKTLSVSELNQLAQKLLENTFPSISVVGEISNFTHHSSGHMYFTVKDDDAAIDAVMYSSMNKKLFFSPKRGDKVVLKSKLSIFKKTGRYQLIVWEMVKSGKGELEQKFIELKNSLEKEGLFDKKHKKEIPTVPDRIGIITSPTGAAIKDIINVITRRFSNVPVVIFPVHVQGKLAAGDICRAMDFFNTEYAEKIDVIILTRGGGSIEDLWPFNEEKVARAVFNSKIPVISAVGHEIDFTICDFVSDLRAPTPSAAAELVIESRQELVSRLLKTINTIHYMTVSILDNFKNKINEYSERESFKYPTRIIDRKKQEIDILSEKIMYSVNTSFKSVRNRIEGIQKQLMSLSPKEVLKRGYSITMDSGGLVLTKGSNLKENMVLNTILYDGELESIIKKIKKGKKYE